MATITLTAAANHAAQYLGVLDSGESLSSQQIADALAAANNLLDNWSDDGLMIPTRSFLTQALSVGTQSYVLGSPPLSIDAAAFTNANGPGGPVEVCSAAKWAAIPDRQARSYVISALYYDRTSTVYVSPVPLGTLTLEMTVWTALAKFADATTPLTLPLAGYARLLELALACELAPQYGKEPSAMLFRNYNDAMARVRNLNAQLLGVEAPSTQTSPASGAPVSPNKAAQ